MPTETTSTTAPWFDTNLDERLTQEVISFFSSYCHLEREALYNHLHSVVRMAFSGAYGLFLQIRNSINALGIFVPTHVSDNGGS